MPTAAISAFGAMGARSRTPPWRTSARPTGPSQDGQNDPPVDVQTPTTRARPSAALLRNSVRPAGDDEAAGTSASDALLTLGEVQQRLMRAYLNRGIR